MVKDTQQTGHCVKRQEFETEARNNEVICVRLAVARGSKQVMRAVTRRLASRRVGALRKTSKARMPPNAAHTLAAASAACRYAIITTLTRLAALGLAGRGLA